MIRILLSGRIIKIIIIIILIFSNFSCKSQNYIVNDKYANLRWKADSLFKKCDYSDASICYIKASKYPIPKRFKRICFYNAFLCNKYLRKIKDAYSLYKKAANINLRYESIESIYNDTLTTVFQSYHSWPQIQNKVVLNSIKYFFINTDLRDTLRSLYLKDQYIRNNQLSILESINRSYDQKISASIFNRLVFQIDSSNRRRLKKIIDNNGWLGIKEVGIDGDRYAWIIIQHSDNDVPFQLECLSKLKQALKMDNATITHYPYLIDRIRINTGRKQLFGTQFKEVKDKEGSTIGLEPLPLENSSMVNKYRNCFNLESIEAYLDYSMKRYNIKSK